MCGKHTEHIKSHENYEQQVFGQRYFSKHQRFCPIMYSVHGFRNEELFPRPSGITLNGKGLDEVVHFDFDYMGPA